MKKHTCAARQIIRVLCLMFSLATIAVAQQSSSSVTFLASDTNTEGSWEGVYGADGTSLAGVTPQNIPSYATFQVQNQENYTWAANTSDLRALKTGSGTARTAACWYNSATFNFDVNFTDGNTHQFALYAVDWDSDVRGETITLVDANSNAVLDTRTITNFAGGVYLYWSISGHVKINVSRTAGANAVISGVFFGRGSAIVPATSTNVISIDFVGQDVPMASTEIAGVVAEPNWNDANSAISSSPLVLVDDTGTATTATATWTSNDIWELPTADQPGNARMMKGYLDTGNTTTTTVSVSGLPSTTNGYNVYVYADGDNGTAARTGVYTISGTGITTSSISLTDAASTNFSGTFTQANNSAGNYVVFTINATAFTISATPGASTDAFPRAPVNGIQIVPLGAPTPDFALSVTPSSQTVNPGSSSSTL